jgi:hypothetical protein
MTNAGALYGLMMGIIVVVLETIGSSVLWTVFWAAQTILVATAALLTWRRTRLFWMTIGMTHGAVILAIHMAAHAAGYTIHTFVAEWRALFLANTAMMPVYVILARWREPDGWKRWEQHAEGMSVLDMLRFRHIPQLRSNSR